MNLSFLTQALRAHWRAALAVWALTVSTSLLLSMSLPRQYRAHATVLIDTSRSDAWGNTLAQGNPSAAYMATQAEVIQSERVAQRVIQNHGLLNQAHWRQRWRDSGASMPLSDWLRDHLLAALEVKPARESNVISVQMAAEQANEASALANAFVQAFLDTSADMRAEPARHDARFFAARSADLRRQLEQAQAQLGEFQRDAGISASEERLDLETARLAELSSQVTSLQALAADSRSRATQAKGAGAEKLPEVLNNPLLVELSADANRSAARLEELRSRLGDKHPQVLDAQAQASAIQTRLDGETRRVAAGAGVSHSIQRQRLADAQAQLAAQRQKVAQIRTAREQASVMQRDVENARRVYDTVLSRWSQAELESQGTPGPARLLSAASVPPRPSTPRTSRHAALAAVGGLLLGVACAWVLYALGRQAPSRPASKGQA